MTTSDGTAARLEQAQSKIRYLSVVVSLLVGVIGGLIAGIIARLLEAPYAGAVGAGGGAFIAVSTLALVVEARINRT